MSVGSCGLWLPSRAVADQLGWAGWKDEPARVRHGWGLYADAGGLTGYYFVSGFPFDNPRDVGSDDPERVGPSRFFWRRYGPSNARPLQVQFSHRHMGETMAGKPVDVYVLGVPVWLPVLLCSLPPAAWAVRRVKRRLALQPEPGLCRRCGYDLRATPHRCPECGEPAPPGAAASAPCLLHAPTA